MTERPASNGETRADAPQVRRGFFPFVDVLRAAAVVMVLVYHLIELFKWANFPTSGLLLGFRAGWVGVELFFVISGFVITLSCARNIEAYGARGYRSPSWEAVSCASCHSMR
ncbi:MAG: acyltransferase family protein [Burkholderiaceae bacterium]